VYAFEFVSTNSILSLYPTINIGDLKVKLPKFIPSGLNKIKLFVTNQCLEFGVPRVPKVNNK
jgi:hypothetical protein